MAQEKEKHGLEWLLGIVKPDTGRKRAASCRVGLAGKGPFLEHTAAAYAILGLDNPLLYYYPRKKKGAALAANLAGARYVEDEDEFINSIDACELFDLPGGRAGFAEKMLKAGIHVSLQKPFARTLEEADALIGAARQSRAILRVNEYALFYEPYIKLKELIDSMEIGEVCAARFRANLAGGGGIGPLPRLLKDENYFFHPAFDRFAFAIHLLGDVDAVCCYANPVGLKKGGQALVAFKYKDDGRYGFLDLTYAPGTSIRTEALPCDDQIEIAGTDGIVWVNHFHGKMTEEPWIEVRRGKKHYSLGIGSDMKLDWSSCLRASAAAFLDCAVNGGTPDLTPKKARRALEFTLAAIESAGSTTEIKF